MPCFVKLATSKIPKANLGVFTVNYTIPNGIVLGPYKVNTIQSEFVISITHHYRVLFAKVMVRILNWLRVAPMLGKYTNCTYLRRYQKYSKTIPQNNNKLSLRPLPKPTTPVIVSVILFVPSLGVAYAFLICLYSTFASVSSER